MRGAWTGRRAVLLLDREKTRARGAGESRLLAGRCSAAKLYERESLKLALREFETFITHGRCSAARPPPLARGRGGAPRSQSV